MKKALFPLVAALIVLLWGNCALLSAQSDDFGVWTSLEAEKKVFKGFNVSFGGEMRTRDGLKTWERWSLSVGATYKIFDWLRIGGGYTFIDFYHPMEVTQKGNYIPEYWQTKHRFYIGLTGKVTWKRFTFSLRERWQYTYRPEQSVPKYDGYYGTAMDDEGIKGKGKNALRSRLQIEYNIKKSPLSPYASCELWHALGSGGYEKTRWTAGVEWKVTKKHGLDFRYLYQNNSDDDESNGHAIGIGYTFKF